MVCGTPIENMPQHANVSGFLLPDQGPVLRCAEGALRIKTGNRVMYQRRSSNKCELICLNCLNVLRLETEHKICQLMTAPPKDKRSQTVGAGFGVLGDRMIPQIRYFVNRRIDDSCEPVETSSSEEGIEIDNEDNRLFDCDYDMMFSAKEQCFVGSCRLICGRMADFNIDY